MDPASVSGSTNPGSPALSPERSGVSFRLKVVAGLVSALIAISFAIALALGALSFPLGVPIISVFGLLSFLMLSLICVQKVKKVKKVAVPEVTMRRAPEIPAGCLLVIRGKYPAIIHGLCVDQSLTIQELRQVLPVLKDESKLDTLPSELYQKLQSFGLDSLLRECRYRKLPPLDEVLTESCFLYFLKRFIELGPKDVPITEGFDPDIYWMSPVGLCSTAYVAFGKFGWLLVNSLDEKEFTLLSDAAKRNNFDYVKDVVESIRERVEKLMETYSDVLSSEDVMGIRYVFNFNKVLYFFLHGMNWDQVKLLRSMPFEMACAFSNFDDATSIRHTAWMLIMGNVYPLLDESSPQYDPGIALLTYEELSEEMEGTSLEATTNITKMDILLQLLSKHSLCDNTLLNEKDQYIRSNISSRWRLFDYDKDGNRTERKAHK